MWVRMRLIPERRVSFITISLQRWICLLGRSRQGNHWAAAIGTHMTSKRIGAAAVIVDDGGRVLLVKHSYGRLNWELPGGGAEVNESAEESVAHAR